MTTNKPPIFQRITYIFLATILFFYGIIVAREFLYPIALAVLFSYLLFPVVNFLEKKGLPRILSILISEILAITLLIAVTIFIYNQLSLFVEDFPRLKTKAFRNIDMLTHKLEVTFGLSDQTVVNYVKSIVRGFFETGSNTFGAFFQNAAGTLVKIGLLPVYVFLFLYYRTKFANFILKIVPDDKKYVTLKILREVSQVATSYMGGVLIVVSILGVLNPIGLSLIGMKYAVTIGIISAMFSFIPYFGTLMGGIFPILLSLLISDNPIISFQILIWYVAVNTLENNILTPNIVGGNLRVNPFFIIISLIIGAIVWGIPGMLVAVPFMAIIKIVFKHVPGLAPYSYLLGNSGTRRHAITVNNIKRLISRFKKSR